MFLMIIINIILLIVALEFVVCMGKFLCVGHGKLMFGKYQGIGGENWSRNCCDDRNFLYSCVIQIGKCE